MTCHRVSVRRFFRRYLLYAALMLIVMASVQVRAFDRQADQADQFSHPINSPASKLNQVHLYFSDRQMRFLFAEKKSVFCAQDEVSLGRCILTALIEGPQRGLVQTLPKQSMLKAFYVTDDGTAYADFNEALARNHPGGVRSELLTVFAIVNSLTLNLSKINRVQLLIDGRRHETLAGHIAISDPFKANILLIR